MNKKLLLLGSVALVAVSTTVVLEFSDSEGVYSKRNLQNDQKHGIEGANDIYYRLKGDFTKEDWLRAMNEAKMAPQDRTTIEWLDQGPDNVGGRTRAILVDNQNVHHVYAGSVSGGLFESFNRGNEWFPVTSFNENLGVSSMCQTSDGVLYVATGHQQEQTGGSQNAYDSGHNGDGVFKKETDGSFTQLPGSSSFSYINEIVCDTVHNKVWIATNSGLKVYDPGSNSISGVSAGLTTGACNALAISTDGQVIVANMSGGKTNVSTDYGVSFTDRSGTAAGKIEAGAGRVEYAISYERGSSGNYHVYASCANTHLVGIWRSTDNGITWTEIAPAGNGGPGTFSPFSHSTTSGQGTYDNIISVQRGNPDRILVGGIDIYSWSSTGNWNQMTQWFYPIQNPQYAHADQHEMVWDEMGRLYIGNDGGVGYSDDGGQTFVPANRGYNVTQFYAIGYSAHGDVIGGAQDNGVQANYHNNATWRSHDEVGGGDGFSSTISFMNRDVLFTSVYNGGIRRSSDRGENSASFIPTEWTCDAGNSEAGCGQFFTNFKMWENPNDLNSTDSITFIPQQSYSTGEIMEVPSHTSTRIINAPAPFQIVYDDTLVFNPSLTILDTIIITPAPALTEYNLAIIPHVLSYGTPPISAGDSIYFTDLDTTVAVGSYDTINHYFGTNPLKPGKVYDMGNDAEVYGISWDTVKVQDPYQSWFAIGLGGGSGTMDNPGGVWMTRNAVRLSANSSEWFKVADGITQVSTMEFSRDGNNLFIGTWDGKLYRLSGFGQVYSPKKTNGSGFLADTLIDWDKGHYATTLTQIGTFGAPVTGIGVEGNVDHVIITLGNFTGAAKVQETTNATGGSPSWSNIMSNLPNMPYYSCVIDREDPNVMLVGGEFGVYLTENGGTSWSNCSGIFGSVPVYDMGQNWRQYNEGCIKPGQIYIGTHGRGIWSTDAYLTLPGDQDNLAPTKFIPNINVYPNPLNEVGNLQFDLENNSDVYVQIFNLNGQLVQEITESNMAAGNQVITFDTNELPRGTYIVRLSAGEMVETTKFIKH